MSQLGYDYRPDGNFMIKKICRECEDSFDVHAMAPVTPEDAYGLCPACEFVRREIEGKGNKR